MNKERTKLCVFSVSVSVCVCASWLVAINFYMQVFGRDKFKPYSYFITLKYFLVFFVQL